MGKVKEILIGRRLATAQLQHQRLSNIVALPVFASDAMSSVAYATEEILLVLSLVAGGVAIHLSIPIASAIVLLFAVVILSYRQTISAYPSGGGSYIVAKENLGVLPGLIAAASLLTDYILTVAVSIASGVAAITSAFPELYDYRVEICVVCVVFITLANLRGVRESGALFSFPAYFFVAGIFVLVATGFFRMAVFHQPLRPVHYPPIEPTMQAVTLFLILRAFSSGCSALTGIEAISNGIPAFRPPETQNARKVLTIMAVLCIVMFSGITLLAYFLKITPTEKMTVVSQISETIFSRNILYYCIQAGTAMILIVGANTSFADFPRLSSILARAGFMPRQMSNLGDRLVFANGIIFLGVLSSVLLIIFQGSTTRLIPLYAVGVFLSFTLSQSGMVVHWLRLREPGWKKSIVFNALGAVATAIVTVVTATAKFTQGAFIVMILIPTLVYVFHRISKHYQDVALALRVENGRPDMSALKNRVYLPISGITSVSLYALRYCFAISKNVTGLYINVNQEAGDKIKTQLDRLNLPIPVTVLESPYRSITEPLIDFLEKESQENPQEIITLVIPEFMPRRKWQYILHNQTAMIIYAALRGRENVVITSVRKRLAR